VFKDMLYCTFLMSRSNVCFSYVAFCLSLSLELECVAREYSRGHDAREFGVSFNLMTRSRGDGGRYVHQKSLGK